MIDSLLRDVRLAARGLWRSPGFTTIAVLTLALGIGANATVFSILDALLIRPLPVAEPNRLFFVQPQRAGEQFPSHSYPDYLDFRNGTQTLAGIAAYRIAAMGLQSGAGTERAWGYLVTGDYFRTLGVRPALGRFFTPAEDVARGASPYAVLSYDTWQRRFGANPGIAGTTLRINGLAYTILGVAPRDFHGTEVFYRPELWVPMSMQPQIEGRSWLDTRSTLNAWVIARLAPGVSADQATADLNRVAGSIAAAHPRSHEGLRISLVRPGFVGDTGRSPAMAFMAGVMGLAVLVLLAACANLASLLTARVIDRLREVAIRLSLGASRARIVRGLLVEAVLMSTIGAVVGLALSSAILGSLSRWQLPLPVPVQLDVNPQRFALSFAAGVTLIVAAVASVAPVRRAWRTQPARLTGGVRPEGGLRRWTMRDFLLAGQVALCCVLVSACAVSLRNLQRALDLPVGFELDGVSTVGFDLALAGYTPAEGLLFQQRALEQVSSLPGVTTAAFANSLPLTIDQSSTGAFPETGEVRSGRAVEASVYQISPDYFSVMRTRLLEGRAFTTADTRQATDVAIVNETFVRRVMRTTDPIGHRFRTGPTAFIEVVGVVEDGKYESLGERPRAAMFRPAAQSYNSTAVIVARTSLPEDQMVHELARVIRDLDPRVPLLTQQSIRDAVAVSFLPARIAGVALTAFGVIALLLSVVGTYGLAAYSVAARRRELGIRIAVGAQRADIVRFAIGRTALLLSVGSAIGLTSSAAANQLFGAVMYHASSRDPFVVLAAASSMAIVGLAAAWVPARRALALDAARTLREA
jgi:predicted permease